MNYSQTPPPLNIVVLPWQTKQWQLLFAARQKNRLPHALLLVGAEGIGKKQFADNLSYSMLCKQPSAEGMACGECTACHLFQAKSHPDFYVIEPEQAGQMIKIDQIREMIKLVNE